MDAVMYMCRFVWLWFKRPSRLKSTMQQIKISVFNEISAFMDHILVYWRTLLLCCCCYRLMSSFHAVSSAASRVWDRYGRCQTWVFMLRLYRDIILLILVSVFIVNAIYIELLEIILIRLYGSFWTKVNRFGWNLDICQPNVGGWPRRTLSAIRAVATVWEGAESFFSVSLITHAFTDFPSDNFHKFCAQQRRSMSWCKLSEQNFENFIIRGRFSKKTQKCLENVPILATSGRHNSGMITDRRILTAKINPYGMSSFHFYRWNQLKLIPLPSTLRTQT